MTATHVALYHADRTNNFSDDEHAGRVSHNTVTLCTLRPSRTLYCIHNRIHICIVCTWNACSHPVPNRSGICTSDNRCHSILDALPHSQHSNRDHLPPSIRYTAHMIIPRAAAPTLLYGAARRDRSGYWDREIKMKKQWRFLWWNKLFNLIMRDESRDELSFKR
jgi:hypothetical protein